MSTPAALAGETITLRPWRTEDAPWYVEWSRDPEARRFTTDSPTLTVAEVTAAITALADSPERVAYLIADRESGQPLGNIALDLTDGVGHVSYSVAAAARGRGVATAALRLLADAAFERLGVHELRLWTHAANAASRRVAERAGFSRDPAADRDREVGGELVPAVGYRRTALPTGGPTRG